MSNILSLTLSPENAAFDDSINNHICKELNSSDIKPSQWKILKKSIDARKKEVKIQLKIEVFEKEIKENEDLWRQENEYAKFIDNSKVADLRNLGVRPESESAVDPDAELPEQDIAGLEGAPDAELGLNTNVPGGPPGPPEEQV